MAKAPTPPAKSPAKQASADLPLFYRNVSVVEAGRHAGKSLKTSIGMGFARSTNVVPVNGTEFEQAARFYPIVFSDAPNPGAFALLGVHQGENLFMTAEDNWKPGAYVPAYVRRYPFIFYRSDDGQQYTLCIDEAAGALEDGNARPLFADGAPAEAAKGAFDFCAVFQRDNEATQKFIAALGSEGILAQNQLNIKLITGESLTIGGLQVVDRAKFDALSSATVNDWRKRGWLGWVYAHLISLAAVADVVELANVKKKN